MTQIRVAVLLLLGPAGLSPELHAQERSVTLADAIRLSERVQPLVVRAAGDIETATAQRRSAWGSYLPTLSASSSASAFSSEGPSRVDPVTGQLLSGNTSNRSLNTSLSASLDLFTGFRRGAEMSAARATQSAAEASFVDARFQQALTTTNQFLDALAAQQLVRVRETSVRRAEEQLKTSIAKLRAGSATRSDSLRSRVTLGNAQLDLIRAQTDLATAEAGLARLIGESGRVKAADDSAFYRVIGMPDTAALRSEAEARSPGSRARPPRPTPRARASRRPGPSTGPASRSPPTPPGTRAGRTTTTSSTSASSPSASAGASSTASPVSWRWRSARPVSTLLMRPPPTSGARWTRSSPPGLRSWRRRARRSRSRRPA